jgi:hypothetical protein
MGLRISKTLPLIFGGRLKDENDLRFVHFLIAVNVYSSYVSK